MRRLFCAACTAPPGEDKWQRLFDGMEGAVKSLISCKGRSVIPPLVATARQD